MADIDLEQTLAQARTLLGERGETAAAGTGSRIDAVTELARTRQRIAEAREQLEDAEREDRNAYEGAVRSGWTADDLRRLGLEGGAGSRRGAGRTPTAAETSTPPHGDPLLDAAEEDTQAP